MRSPCPGLTMRRTQQGVPVIRLHISADPHWTPEKIAELKAGYESEAFFEQEININYEARSGQQVYPEWSPDIHVIPDDRIPRYGCRYMAIDPHPRTPHAALWVLIDAYSDWYFYREHWPSILYGNPRNPRDDDAEKQYTVWEYADAYAFLEGNRIEWRHQATDHEFGLYREMPIDDRKPLYPQVGSGERIIFRMMDQAAKGFQVSGEGQQYETIATRYSKYGIQCLDPKKAHQAGEDAVRALLKPRTNDMRGVWPRAHFAESLEETILEFPRHRYKRTNRANDEKDLKQDRAESRCHMLDLVRYLATSNAYYERNLAS